MGGPVDVFLDVSVGNNCCRRMGQSRTKKLVKVLGIFEKIEKFDYPHFYIALRYQEVTFICNYVVCMYVCCPLIFN